MKRHKFIKATAQEIKRGDIIRYKETGCTWIVEISSIQEVNNGIEFFGKLLPMWTRVLDDNGKWTKELTNGRDNYWGLIGFKKKLEIAIN